MGSTLSIRNLSKSYGAVVIADDLGLELAEGEALGMLGPNGTGKTTLFGMISGNITPDKGTVSFAGEDITHASPARRARMGIGRSYQIPQPFGGMTVFENLVVAGAFAGGRRESDIYQFAGETLELCGLFSKANQRANSLTLLDRKRLELARALVAKPRLLLLDEVAGGLTEQECEALVALIRRIRGEGLSIIWIEHIVHALVAVVDRIVVLSQGRFIADGKPEEAVNDPRVLEIYMGIPTG